MDFFKSFFDVMLCFVLPYLFYYAPAIKTGYFKDIQVDYTHYYLSKLLNI